MKPRNRFYRACYCIARAALSFLYWVEIKGKENIPEGAAMVCANHSSLLDPFFLAFAFGINRPLHMMGKIELFRIPFISRIIVKLGMISVNRGKIDGDTLKKTLGYLNNGEKVAIFPEGTRASEDNAVVAKNGAIKFSERAKVPIVPAYIPRKKGIFRRMSVVIGEPYYIEKTGERRTPEEYSALADELMERIKALNPVKK